MSPEELLDKAIQTTNRDALIAIYQQAEWMKKQIEHVQKFCLDEVEKQMDQSSHYSSPAGTCGYVREMKLDEESWNEALKRDDNLDTLVLHYKRAIRRFEDAQKPFMTSSLRFFIQ